MRVGVFAGYDAARTIATDTRGVIARWVFHSVYGSQALLFALYQ